MQGRWYLFSPYRLFPSPVNSRKIYVSGEQTKQNETETFGLRKSSAFCNLLAIPSAGVSPACNVGLSQGSSQRQSSIATPGVVPGEGFSCSFSSSCQPHKVRWLELYMWEILVQQVDVAMFCTPYFFLLCCLEI